MSAGFTTLFCILENEDGGFPNKPRQYWVNCQVSAVIKVLGMHLSWKVSGNLKIEVDPVNYEGLDLNKNDQKFTVDVVTELQLWSICSIFFINILA